MVITHEHPDHIVGLARIDPGIEIVAQEGEAGADGQDRPAQHAGLLGHQPGQGGRPGDVNRVILPTVTFRDRMSVWYGDTQVDFIWPGRARTSGDALILLPKEKMFMGDITFHDIPPLNGSGFIAELDQGLRSDHRRPQCRDHRAWPRADRRPAGTEGHAGLPRPADAGRASQFEQGRERRVERPSRWIWATTPAGPTPTALRPTWPDSYSELRGAIGADRGSSRVRSPRCGNTMR